MKIKTIVLSLIIGLSSGLFVNFTYEDDDFFEISKNLDIFTSLFKEVNLFYVDKTKPGDMIKNGVDAMLKSLDPYTNYIPEADIEDYRFMTTGQYGGIGSVIRRKDEYIMIAQPYQNSPSDKAGLMAGDIIIEVDGKSAKDKSTEELSKILKGEPNTKVGLLIKRKGHDELIQKTLIREEIKVKDVPYFGLLDDNTGYIKLNSFTETASKEVKDALKELKEKHNIANLVLDLRGNGGGLLREAVNIVNIFVKKGQEVVSTKGKVKQWDQTYKTLNEPLDENIPLVVLIDGHSASASEIVSGCLQDLDRAVIIGENSFGKGLVQQTRDLSYNAKLKVTVAHYYIPSGRCIQRLDYTNRGEDGKVTAVPDSLRQSFTTKNGRSVKDGNGIAPDLMVESEKGNYFLGALFRDDIIFDFATEFRIAKDSITKAKTFTLSDKEIAQFKSFVLKSKLEYTTPSEDLLTDLEKSIQESPEDSLAKRLQMDALKSMKVALNHNTEKDFNLNLPLIKEFLEEEICGRYYYIEGQIEKSLANDSNIKEALSTLNNKEKYGHILTVN